MEIILVRGLPGSGKSTFANRVIKDHGKHILCEADDYFMIDGIYKFDPKELKYAHRMCQIKARMALHHGKDVIVSNTFVKKWEMQVYYKLAEEFEAEVFVLVKKGNYKNIHGVPDWKLEQMQRAWED